MLACMHVYTWHPDMYACIYTWGVQCNSNKAGMSFVMYGYGGFESEEIRGTRACVHTYIFFKGPVYSQPEHQHKRRFIPLGSVARLYRLRKVF